MVVLYVDDLRCLWLPRVRKGEGIRAFTCGLQRTREKDAVFRFYLREGSRDSTDSPSTSRCLEVSWQTGERVYTYAEYYSLARRQVGSAVTGVVRKCPAIVDETRVGNITANALLRVLVEPCNFLHHWPLSLTFMLLLILVVTSRHLLFN
jgi:hypothetical protein